MKRKYIQILLFSIFNIGYTNALTTILWDNTNIGTSTGVLMSTYWTGDDGKILSADDFTADDIWVITAIHTKAGGQCGASIPATKYGISIYTDNNGIAGTEIFSDKNLSDSGSDGMMVLALSTPCTLPSAGKYWISVYAVFNMNTPTPVTSARWNVLRGNAVIGDEMIMCDPANVFNDTQFQTWNSLSNGNYNQFSGIHSMYFSIEGTISSSVGNQNIFSDQFTIWPNPTSGIIRISGNDFNKLEVYNATGQLIISKVNNEKELDLSNNPKGIYFLKIYDSNQKAENIKIIINK